MSMILNLTLSHTRKDLVCRGSHPAPSIKSFVLDFSYGRRFFLPQGGKYHIAITVAGAGDSVSQLFMWTHTHLGNTSISIWPMSVLGLKKCTRSITQCKIEVWPEFCAVHQPSPFLKLLTISKAATENSNLCNKQKLYWDLIPLQGCLF